MKAFIGRFSVKLRESRSGFTLVEMLVVVAIIVALAAVIVPTVTIFLGRGEAGARKAEAQTVQTAVDALMTDLIITSVEPNLTSPTRVWGESNGGVDFSPGSTPTYLEKYLKATETLYCYTWTTEGLVTQDPDKSPEDPCS